MQRYYQGGSKLALLFVVTAIMVSSLASFGGAAIVHAQTGAIVGDRYFAADAGFEMLIPRGWNGTQVDRMHAVFSPMASDSDPSDAFITVLVTDRLDTKRLMTSEIDISSGKAAVQEDWQCQSLDGEIVSLRAFEGKKIFHTIRECSGPEGYKITDTYVIFTPTKTVAVSLCATSMDSYDRHVVTFRDYIETARIRDPFNFRASLEIILGTTRILTQDVNLEAANSQVGLLVATSSRVSTVNFDEQSKSIVVNLSEIRRPDGSLLVAVNELLIGPYVVYIDGELHDDFLVITDNATQEQLVNIWYVQGTHEIAIIGTEVVPEFDIGIAVILGATISAVLLHSRIIRKDFFNSR